MMAVEIREERLSIELERLLRSTHFSQSKRAQNFLRYIVSETVAGRGSELKERTIGAIVFHKALDYDTGNDSVVRVAANDVRKRIAQYYQDDGADCDWIIELPPGTYIPTITPRHAALAHSLTTSSHPPAPHLQPIPPETHATPTVEFTPSPVHVSPLLRWGIGGVVTLLLIAMLGRSVYARHNLTAGAPAFDPVWQAFQSPDLTIFSIGFHDVPPAAGTDDPMQTPTVMQLNTLESVPVSDVIAIASLSDFMGRREIPYRIVAAKDISLARLRRHPTVLFGGLDNVWTLKLTKELPFTFATTRTVDHKVLNGMIRETAGSQRTWSIDFTSPSVEWKKDYAIISRFQSADTGMPVVVVAGIGSAGTLSAMEFMTDPKYVAELQSAGVSREKPNFEAVLSTNVIDGDSGPPRLEAIRVW